MLNRIAICALAGAAAGAVLGALAGGIWAACFGQPFSGATGLRVFPAGMWFPGVIVAPVTAGVGAAAGAFVGATTRPGERDE